MFPGDVAFPNTTPYIQSSNYWSNQQSETHPRCFVTPRSKEAVSAIMVVLTHQNVPFTVKSGGHVPFAGGSSIVNGVTVDMFHLNEIVVSSDRKTVSIGPGNRWVNVTDTIGPMGLAIVGGRTADVGVSGLILGGGISYFSGSKGWASDNVRNFEVVLASGKIVNASPAQNTDLYWALRGGGGLNFGIVTRFDLMSFDQGKVWESSVTVPESQNQTVVSLFQNLTIQGLPQDPLAHSVLLFLYNATTHEYVSTTSFWHATVPTQLESIPAVFEPFQSMPSATLSAPIATDVSTLSRDVAIPYGFRQTWGNTVFSADFPRALTADIMSLWRARNTALFAALKGTDTELTVAPTLLFQSIPVNVLQQMQKNGGNPMGLTPEGGPLILISLPIQWNDPVNDAIIEESTQKLIADIAERAKVYGVHKEYVYMNYAGKNQAVMRGYGAVNYDKLKSIARKYDPKGKLAELWMGLFKLDS
jgi:FAD/FMN-containing dehydrogenase